MSELDRLIAELCPDGVEYVRLENICHISRGRVMSKDYLRDNAGDYPVYSSQTANKGVFGYIDNYDYECESVTWTTDGANAGSVFYHSNEKYSITNVCGLLRVKDASGVNTKYMYYCLQVSAKAYVNDGMGNPKLMSNVMASVEIPLPPIAVQNEIVRILDNFTELTAELTAKITAEITARKNQYEYYRDKLLAFGDDVPMANLGEIVNMKAGKFIQAIDISNVKNDEYCYPCYGGNGLRGFVKTYNQKGEYLLIGRQGALCGNVKRVDEKFYATEHAVVVDSGEQVNVGWLFHMLVHMNLNQYASKSAQPGLAVGNLEKFEIPLPSLEEQSRIVAILDKFDTLTTDITSGLPAEIDARNKQYEYYRDKLLTFKEKVQ